ncbi:TIGR04222 domain-containing membrane protein [Nonomuraea sp. PA05]|uniref:TIGR04222 domain-containing membrane protein n=1 Tax=Nonomuraea sp. PA05 TaxID=2604466 RepID=UPI0011D387FF|nr:TIGR04222 domain-containing membrane protein [Nonomuraea sp. PA05]TYB62697.1 TIGR04222 domain-containing membrane protein [Nonomuraea sp. PA05]
MDLFLLIVSVVVAAYAAVTTSAIQRAHIAIRDSATGTRYRDLDHYELAYLVGGPRRVADTAIAVLAARSDIRVSRGGQVHKVATSTLADKPIEQSVLGRVAEHSGLPVASLRAEVMRSLTMQRMGEHLTAEGLLLPDSEFVQVRRLSLRLRVLSVPAYAGFAIEGLTLALTPSLHALLATLVFLGTVIGAEVVLAGHRGGLRAKLTPSGRQALDAARQARSRGSGGPVPLALYGVSEVRDSGLRAELARQKSSRVRSGRTSYGVGSGSCGGGAYGGSGCGSGSSSCGGSSGCGGGGCGGGS